MDTIELKNITLVRSHKAAQLMRAMRNSVREYMTHNSAEISWFQQLKWYRTTYKPALKHGTMYGFVMGVNFTPIGYGLITLRDGKYWVSGGVRDFARGRGYGEDIFQFLTEFVHQQIQWDEVYLDVFDDNLPAKKLYRKLGYKKVGSAGGVTVMVHRRKGVQ